MFSEVLLSISIGKHLIASELLILCERDSLKNTEASSFARIPYLINTFVPTKDIIRTVKHILVFHNMCQRYIKHWTLF